MFGILIRRHVLYKLECAANHIFRIGQFKNPLYAKKDANCNLPDSVSKMN